jgi:hypothetical protein
MTRRETMEEKIDLMTGGRKRLERLSLEEVPVDQDLKHIEVEGGSIDLEIFKAEKVEKVVLSTVRIHARSVSEGSVFVWPADSYDLPLFWYNLTQMPGMNMFIADLTPMVDIVVWPEYGEKYLDDLHAVKNSAIEKLKDGIVEKELRFSTKTMWAMSPHCTILSLTDAGASELDPIIDEYTALYLRLWEGAAPMGESEESEFSKRKKKATRKTMKENDPGYPFMVNVFGEEKTKKMFDLVF